MAGFDSLTNALVSCGGYPGDALSLTRSCVLSDPTCRRSSQGNLGVFKYMAEEPRRRRSRQKRSSTKAKLRQQAKIQKIIWISALVAIAVAIVVIFTRYAVLAAN